MNRCHRWRFILALLWLTLNEGLCLKLSTYPRCHHLESNKRSFGRSTTLSSASSTTSTGASSSTSHPQASAPFVEALLSEAAKIKAPYFFPGHGMGGGISPTDPFFGTPFDDHHLDPQQKLTQQQHQQQQGAANLNPLLRLDLPELPGLGSADSTEGPLREAQDLAAAAFGAKRTWFLTNGSTGGLQAAILAAVQLFHHHRHRSLSTTLAMSSLSSTTLTRGSTAAGIHTAPPLVAIPRNAHRSIINALILSGAQPMFLEVEYSPEGLPLGVNIEKTLKRALSYNENVRSDNVDDEERPHPTIAAVVLVSPSYHGVVCDVAGASEACKQAGVYPLIVDEAHGAHLKFMTSPHSSSLSSASQPPLSQPSLLLSNHECKTTSSSSFSSSAKKKKKEEAAALRGALFNGADVVVQSTHKTLTALTQAAMMHLGQGTKTSTAVGDSKEQLDQKGFDNPLPSLTNDDLQQQRKQQEWQRHRSNKLEVALCDSLGILASSSQSSLLLASLDNARRQFANPDLRLMKTKRHSKHDDDNGKDEEATLSHSYSSHGARRLRRAMHLMAIVRDTTENKLGFKVFGNQLSESSSMSSSSSSMVALDPLRLTVFIPSLKGGEEDSSGGSDGGGGFEADELLIASFGVYCELPEELAMARDDGEGTGCNGRQRLNGGALTFAFNAGTTASHARMLLKGLKAVADKAVADKRAVFAAKASANHVVGGRDNKPYTTQTKPSRTEAVQPKMTTTTTTAAATTTTKTSATTTRVLPRDAKTMPPRDAYFSPRVEVDAMVAVGKISVETVCVYPPGVPLLTPGQVVHVKAVAYLQAAKEAGATITGIVEEEEEEEEEQEETFEDDKDEEVSIKDRAEASDKAVEGSEMQIKTSSSNQRPVRVRVAFDDNSFCDS